MPERPQTVAELNRSAWYRLVKVLYLFSLVAVLTVGIGLSLSESTPLFTQFNHSLTSIQCLAGNRRELFAADERIDITEADVKASSLPDSMKLQIRALCQISNQEVQERLATFVDGGNIIGTRQGLYKVKPHFEEGRWPWFLGISAMVSVVTLLSFEFLRRAFYYVALGSLFPKKQ